MPRPVAIVGIGSTKMGIMGHSLRDLAVEAGISALTDAGMAGNEIQALWVGKRIL
jgi:acetyl-CoA C-acetyltransferase